MISAPGNKIFCTSERFQLLTLLFWAVQVLSDKTIHTKTGRGQEKPVIFQRKSVIRIQLCCRNKTCIYLPGPLYLTGGVHRPNCNFISIALFIYLWFFFSNERNCIVCRKVFINKLWIVFFIIMFWQKYRTSGKKWPVVPYSSLLRIHSFVNFWPNFFSNNHFKLMLGDVGFFVDLLISSLYFNKQVFAPRCGASSGSTHFPLNPLQCLHFF